MFEDRSSLFSSAKPSTLWMKTSNVIFGFTCYKTKVIYSLYIYIYYVYLVFTFEAFATVATSLVIASE